MSISLVESNQEKAVTLIDQGMEMYLKDNKRIGRAVGLNYLGQIAHQQSLWEVAKCYFQEAYSILLQLNDTREIGGVINNLGIAFLSLGNYDAALKCFDESIKRHEKFDIQGVAMSQCNIGIAYEGIEDWQKSMRAHIKSVSLFERLGNLRHLWNAYLNVSRVSARIGDIILAEENIQKAKYILLVGGSKIGLAEANRVEGLIKYLKKEWDQALSLFDKSDNLCREINDKHGKADTLRERAYMFIEKGDHVQAMDLLKQAKKAFDDIGSVGDANSVKYKMDSLQKGIQ